MKYVVYFLEFDTPLHFGCGENGGKLETASLEYRADTLFGALCCELADYGDQTGLERLYQQARDGKLLLSDLFPYTVEEAGKGNIKLFLPKPIRPLDRTVSHELPSFAALKEDATREKSKKKMAYIRVSQLEDFLQGKELKWDQPGTGMSQVVSRVNCQGEQPLPYYVQENVLPAHSGLYGILAYEEEEGREWILDLLEKLGITGIGGKRSSGLGKFHFGEDWIDLFYPLFHDDMVLAKLLQTEGKWVMNLSVLLPCPEEVSTVKSGYYTLLKRSGFLSSNGNPVQKKQDIYMLQAGSCFPKRIQGTIADVSWKADHPVWRYGKGLFIGLG